MYFEGKRTISRDDDCYACGEEFDEVRFKRHEVIGYDNRIEFYCATCTHRVVRRMKQPNVELRIDKSKEKE